LPDFSITAIQARAARDAAIEEAWLAGATKHELALRYGISEQRVRQILRKRGARERRERIIELERDGGGWLDELPGNSNAVAGDDGAAKATTGSAVDGDQP
jgi:hypothetical protein